MCKTKYKVYPFSFTFILTVLCVLIAKRVCVGECVGNRSVGRPRKRWIDTVKECLKKRGLDVRQARKMVQEWCEWRGFMRGNAWGVAREMNP